jgi:hypothetical protein
LEPFSGAELKEGEFRWADGNAQAFSRTSTIKEDFRVDETAKGKLNDILPPPNHASPVSL